MLSCYKIRPLPEANACSAPCIFSLSQHLNMGTLAMLQVKILRELLGNAAPQCPHLDISVDTFDALIKLALQVWASRSTLNATLRCYIASAS